MFKIKKQLYLKIFSSEPFCGFSKALCINYWLQDQNKEWCNINSCINFKKVSGIFKFLSYIKNVH